MTIGAEGTGRKILIVDDEARMRRVIADYLRIKGYETAEAADGVEALEKFAAEPPDLVLLDVMMPRMDGWEVCRRIRARSQVPVIMLTAKGEEEDELQGFSLGARRRLPPLPLRSPPGWRWIRWDGRCGPTACPWS